jgi:hypothetical protein
MLSLRNAMRSFGYLLVLLACIIQFVSAQGSNVIVVPPKGFQITAGQPTTIEYTNPSLRSDYLSSRVSPQVADISPIELSPFSLSQHLPVGGLTSGHLQVSMLRVLSSSPSYQSIADRHSLPNSHAPSQRQCHRRHPLRRPYYPAIPIQNPR